MKKKFFKAPKQAFRIYYTIIHGKNHPIIGKIISMHFGYQPIVSPKNARSPVQASQRSVDFPFIDAEEETVTCGTTFCRGAAAVVSQGRRRPALFQIILKKYYFSEFVYPDARTTP